MAVTEVALAEAIVAFNILDFCLSRPSLLQRSVKDERWWALVAGSVPVSTQDQRDKDAQTQ